MIISNRGRSNSSKCKRAAATLFILLFTLGLVRAESIGARAKTWIEIKAAHKAAEALANPNVTAKERLRVEQIYYQLVRDNPQSVPAQNALAAFLWKNGKRKQPSNICASRKGWSRRMGERPTRWAGRTSGLAASPKPRSSFFWRFAPKITIPIIISTSGTSNSSSAVI